MATSSQDTVTFSRNMIAHINQMINVLHDLNMDYDRLQEDPNLAAAAAAEMNKAGRPNLTPQNFTDAADAIFQIQFAFTSGTPTQKSKLYAML